MSEDPKPLEVIVFGNTAVGKTSLLSSMYMQMTELGIDSCNGMVFQPLNDEFNVLRDKWIQLRKNIRSSDFISEPVLPYDGTQATFNEHPFEFQTLKKHYVINFVDTKGGATGRSDPALVSRLNTSLLAFCVVDASVLMEMDDIDNDELNAPDAIRNLLKKVLEDDDNYAPFACMFILTKCEKYMRTEADRDRLASRFEEVFKKVLDYAYEKRFLLLYLPVQTLGCVEFSRIDPVTKEMKFKTTSNDLRPVDTIFPLALVLKYMLLLLEDAQTRRNSTFWGPIISWWYSLNENFNAYKKALMDKVGTPTDFRGNWANGKINPNLEKMDF